MDMNKYFTEDNFDDIVFDDFAALCIGAELDIAYLVTCNQGICVGTGKLGNRRIHILKFKSAFRNLVVDFIATHNIQVVSPKQIKRREA